MFIFKADEYRRLNSDPFSPMYIHLHLPRYVWSHASEIASVMFVLFV